MTEMKPLVDVVLLNSNGARHTVECLESLLRSDYPAFRVIVADNKSTDDSLLRIRDWLCGEAPPFDADDIPAPLRAYVLPPVAKPIAFVEAHAGDDLHFGETQVAILHVGHNAGFSGGNNSALRASMRTGARYMWLLNNDTVVAPDCLTELVREAELLPKLGVVGGTLLEYREPHTIQAASGGTISVSTGSVLRINQIGRPRASLNETTTDFNFVSGCSLLIRREALEDIGLLDERFFIYAEDGDYSLRMRKNGWDIGYAPRASIWHKGSASTVKGSPFNDYHHVRSSLLFVHKWHRWRLPLAFVYWAYRGAAPKIVRRQWSRLAAVRRGMSDAVRVMLST
ncbi:MAG TPA: glycosyltransferase family 2 protein [Gemmatimonadaceae bacterium]|jgi:hypothetical protein